MEIKLFTDLIDALGKVANWLKVIPNLPEARREKCRQRGELRARNGQSQIVDVHPGVCLAIPLGTRFQFRSFGHEPLSAIGVTVPPWPGEGEAIILTGEWQPTVT